MNDVMDHVHQPGQLLFKELKTRFPEVPPDVIGDIMYKNFNHRERCIEMLARECQKYQSAAVVGGTIDPMDVSNGLGKTENWERLYGMQRSESNGSRGSLSSVGSANSGGGGGGGAIGPATSMAGFSTGYNSMSPAMKGSISYPYLPPSTASEATSRLCHDPAPRSSLPLTADGYNLSRVGGGARCHENCLPAAPFNFSDRFPGTAADVACHPPEMHCKGGANCGQYSCQPGLLGYPSSNLVGYQPGSVTSEVKYMVGANAGDASSRAQSVWAQRPTFHSETRLNLMTPVPATNHSDTGESSQPTAGQFSDIQPSNSFSALFIHPVQAFVNNNPASAAKFVSSLSSSCESLPSSSTVLFREDSETSARWQPPSVNVSSNTSRRGSGALLQSASDDADNDTAYVQALRICQTNNFDKLFRLYKEISAYRNNLLSTVTQLEGEVMERLRLRNSSFPTSEDVRKLQDENRQLQLELQLLTREVDLAGDVPLGITDPQEQESFIRSNSMRQRQRSSSSRPPSSNRGSLDTTPLTPPSVVIAPHHCTEASVPPFNVQLSTADQRVDDGEGEGWSCSACTFINHPALRNCECCDMPKVPPFYCICGDLYGTNVLLSLVGKCTCPGVTANAVRIDLITKCFECVRATRYVK